MSEPIEMMETPETPKISYKYRTQHLRGTTAQWEEYGEDFIPLAGEIVIEFDDEHSLHKLKIGDGNTSYHDLAYVMAGKEVITQVLPRVITVTLNANEWQLIDDVNDPKYGWSYQELSIDQIQINDEIIIDNPITQQSRLDLQPTADLIDEFKRLQLNFTTENNRGTMYIYSSGNLPTKDYTMQATIVETNVEEGTDIIVGVPIIASPIVENGTVVSHNADFAEVVEWADGNPSGEDRTGYFVCANVPLDGIIMKKATSIDDVKGVTILTPAFAGNYTADKLDADGNLLPKYSYVAIIGFVPVIDKGRCTVGGRCMPDDDGCAIPSSNSMGYQVVKRIDENRVQIIIEPNGDMVQRIKARIKQLQEDVYDLAPDQTFDPTSENAQSGKAVFDAIKQEVGWIDNMSHGLNVGADGDGTKFLMIAPATQIAIDKKEAAYNPIVPKMLDYAVQAASDQTYNPNSVQPQSGKAVKEALDDLKTINGESLIGGGDIIVKAANVDGTYTPNSDNAQSGKAVKGALDTLKTINGQSLVGGGDIVIGANGTINIDEIYTPDSSNAQSGKAVKSALDSLKTVNGQSLVGGGNIVIDTVDVDDTFVPDSSKPQSGKAVADALTSYTTKEYVDNIAKNPIIDYIECNITNDNSVSIVSCDTRISGSYIIPDIINGCIIKDIHSNAFSNCIGLTGITIPDGIRSIKERTFSECGLLTNIIIPSGVTSIGMEVFNNCSSLTSITIPDSVTSIGYGAFSGCRSLKDITIPSGIMSISEFTFNSCGSIISINIPNSIRNIYDSAFSGCSKLTDIYYEGTEEQWKKINIGVNNECLTNATIHYNQIVVNKDYIDNEIIVNKNYIDNKIIENKNYIDNKIKVYSSEEDIDENLPEGTIIFITE